MRFRMISFVRRRISSAQGLFNETILSHHCHVFEKLAFGNLEELNQLLLNNVIFNKNGLILLNKPYGLKKESVEHLSPKKGLITKLPAIERTDHLSFTGVLKPLSKELKTKELELVKAPERYISGVSILSNSDVIRRRVQKSLGDPSIPLCTYLAICVGIPIKLSDRCKLGFTILEKNNMKKAIFVNKYSGVSLRKQLVVPVVMNHDTLAVNDSLNVSLVRIQNNRNKWHAVRAFCGLRLLAPILGDTFYNSCVRHIDGKPMPVDPFSHIANFPAKLPTKLLLALELKPENRTIIPTHLHLSGINLQKLGEEQIFVAKPSDHFLWTCEKLNLLIPEIYLQNGPVKKQCYFVNSVEKCAKAEI